MTVRVKICGISSEDALDAALSAGADYVGFVHYEKSPRHVSLDTARRLVDRVRARSRARSVVLLVDPSDDLLRRIGTTVAPDMIQLHGSESPTRILEAVRLAGAPVIKAVSVATAADVARGMDLLQPRGNAEIVLFDAKPPALPGSLPGGNGLAFDWRLMAPAGGHRNVALAGGLNPQNVAEAIRLTEAAIVDVSSGVETAPGQKSPELIRHFLSAAKAAKQAH